MGRDPLTGMVSSKTADGFIQVTDGAGHVWCEYHPERQVIRKYRRIKGKGILITAEIHIDRLIENLLSDAVSTSITTLPED